MIGNKEMIRISPAGVFIRGKKVDSSDKIFQLLPQKAVEISKPTGESVVFTIGSKEILEIKANEDFINLKKRKSKNISETYKYFRIWLATGLLRKF